MSLVRVPRLCLMLVSLVLVGALLGGCSEDTPSGFCKGTGDPAFQAFFPDEGQAGYDAALAKKALQYDRHYHAFAAQPMGVGTDMVVALASAEKREKIRAFLQDGNEWDYKDGEAGPEAVIESWSKTAGLYAGAAASADAMRYAVLRAKGADCAELERARGHLITAMKAVQMAFTIGGKPGVVARGFAKKGLPGQGTSTTPVPLKDESGNPLPAEKNNGTWREDNSGLYPDYYWEDSCSRDMILGWAAAMGIGMEVMRGDDSFPAELKASLKTLAHNTVVGLRVVHKSGYDLEIPDADGRTTFHGYLNEHCIERVDYLQSFNNGFYALMALGIVSALASASEDPADMAYVTDELCAARKLPEIARDHMIYIDMGDQSNYSNYNMAFHSALLALRYLPTAAARKVVADAVENTLYRNKKKGTDLAAGLKQSFFDLIHLYALEGGGTTPKGDGAVADEKALGDALETLNAFPTPPYWDYAVEQCDAQEIAAMSCTLSDGTSAPLTVGRGGDNYVSQLPVPKAIRRPSNYEWRSNPHDVNGGGDGSNLFSADDFRAAYWLGRFIGR